MTNIHIKLSERFSSQKKKHRMNPTPADARERKRLYLRASIKLLVGIGFIFLLVPFVGSLPWPEEKIPEGSVTVAVAQLTPGAATRFPLDDGSAVYVVRNTPALRATLDATPPERLWFPSAPGLAAQDYFVLRATSALDEAVTYKPAAGPWPGGFVAESGAAWDIAGRALKPGPGHPTGYAMTVQNLPPMPWRLRHDHLLLMPLPASAPPETE
jgi:hypothetical protein